MATSPDMRFDIDALFNHMVKNLGHELHSEMTWSFTLRSEDFDKLESVAESLGEEFDIHLQEEVPTIENDEEFVGPPMLSINRTAALKPAEVKALAARIRTLADKHGLEYEGVTSYEPIDEEELFGWLDLESATWRLRHFTDTGLEEGSPMPWVFAVVSASEKVRRKISAALGAGGFDLVQDIDPDEGEDAFLSLIRRDGTNDEAALTECYESVERIVNKAGGDDAEFLGVQFFDESEEDDE
jgi:hypothetical protein